MTVKQLIYKSPAAKFAKDVEAQLQMFSLGANTGTITGNRTVYCISPYKTGTTFLSSSFKEEISRHEPFQYLTLKRLDKNFDDFFNRRLNKLNLKLECSGFWSAYIDELTKNPIARELSFICVLRSPSSWITSVINYWNRSYIHGMYFEYLNDLFWRPKVGIDIREILDGHGNADETMINKLVDFYFSFTKDTKKLKNMYYIPLRELREKTPLVGEIIGEKPDFSRTYAREAKKKVFVYRNDVLDKQYHQLISELPILSSEAITSQV